MESLPGNLWSILHFLTHLALLSYSYMSLTYLSLRHLVDRTFTDGTECQSIPCSVQVKMSGSGRRERKFNVSAVAQTKATDDGGGVAGFPGDTVSVRRAGK